MTNINVKNMTTEEIKMEIKLIADLIEDLHYYAHLGGYAERIWTAERRYDELWRELCSRPIA